MSTLSANINWPTRMPPSYLNIKIESDASGDEERFFSGNLTSSTLDSSDVHKVDSPVLERFLTEMSNASNSMPFRGANWASETPNSSSTLFINLGGETETVVSQSHGPNSSPHNVASSSCCLPPPPPPPPPISPPSTVGTPYLIQPQQSLPPPMKTIVNYHNDYTQPITTNTAESVLSGHSFSHHQQLSHPIPIKQEVSDIMLNPNQPTYSHMPGIVHQMTVLTVSSPISPIDQEEQKREKLEHKRRRNREAARKCRLKKIEKIDKLKIHLQSLTRENNSLGEKLNKLKEDVHHLHTEVKEHMNSGCPIVLDQICYAKYWTKST